MAPAPLRLRDEAGIGLIEVMVTAAIVLLIALATVTSIEASQKQSGRTLARGVVANLAERDQERLRAMPAGDLINYSETATTSQEGASYTVDSSGVLVQDEAGAAVSCTSTGDQARFVRLTSTVTPPTATRESPITVSSLAALPVNQFAAASGTLIVKVVRKDGTTGVPATSVEIDGPTDRTAVTDAQGCALFQFVTAGSYDVTASRSGWTDKSLGEAPSSPFTVSPGAITNAAMVLEPAGTIQATIDTNNTTQTFRAPGITVVNSEISTTSKSRTFSGTATAGGLFPFDTDYQVFSGTCAANDPTKYSSNYHTANPGFGKGKVGQTVKVREPDINAIVSAKYAYKNGNRWETATGTFEGVPVVVTQTDSGCGSQQYTTETDSNGRLKRVGHPFGTFRVCAYVPGTYYSSQGQARSGTWNVTRSGVANTGHTGTAEFTMTLDTTTNPNGGC